jgi:hypothetical protein
MMARSSALYSSRTFPRYSCLRRLSVAAPLDAAIANEETFGPVVVVEVVDTPDDAIAAANRTMYGVTSSILAGIVNVNSPTVNDEIHAPMGGVRDIGWGRMGPRSLDDFSDVIWINSHSGQRHIPSEVTAQIVRRADVLTASFTNAPPRP